MNPCIGEFSHIYSDQEEQFVLFYDADVISREKSKELMQSYGIINNDSFKNDTPCFFLPKGQADILRYLWVPNKVNSVLDDILNNLNETKNDLDPNTLAKCISIINKYKKEC